MTKNTVIAILLVICLGSGAYVLRQHDRISTLEAQLAARESTTSKTARPGLAEARATAPTGATIIPADNREQRAGGPDEDQGSSPRMMRGLSKIMDNPAMNKMITVQQRATIEAMYEEFAEGLNLTADEHKHFMDLLLAKQMKRVEFGMQMMGGITPEQQATLMEEVEANDKYIKDEIEFFLNDQDDLAAFNYYEKTTMERTAVSGFAEKMAQSGHPLEDRMKTDLTRIMFEEREKTPFTVEFSEEDGDLGKFTSANIDTYSRELKEVNTNILGRASGLLNEDQLKDFSASLDENVGMIRAQLEMVGGMFGTLDGNKE